MAAASAETKEPVKIVITTSLYVEDPHRAALDGLIEWGRSFEPYPLDGSSEF